MNDHNPCDDDELAVRIMQMIKSTWSVTCPICRHSPGTFNRAQYQEAFNDARNHLKEHA